MWLKIFYYAAVLIILAYLMITIIKFRDIPPSISQTYYIWKGAGKEWLFTMVMWITGISVLIYWISAAELYRCQFLPFVSISGMCFVGGACMFKETLTKEVHYTSAGIWAIGAVLFFAINQMFYPMVVGIGVGVIGWLLNKRNNFTFWAEIACVVQMIVGIWLI